MPEPAGALVLGLGNPLMTDDGAGLAILARLRAGWRIPPQVELVDGGTWGMNLLHLIEAAGQLVLADAIRNGLPAGSLVVMEREELPRYLSHKLSPHQVDLREVLALAELRGTLPLATVAIGIEPAEIELGTTLSPQVEERLEAAAAAVVDRLAAWGHECPPLVAAHA
jgi:hydrogenase maturation protease